MERFWPRPQNEDYEDIKICHGLCKNLLSLSQLSLDQLYIPDSPTNNNSSALSNKHLSISSLKSHLTDPNIECDPPASIIAPKPPILSDESIYNMPPIVNTPKSAAVKNFIKNNSNYQNGVESSDTDQESVVIPPMKLLDLTPIRNNIKEAPIVQTNVASPLLKSKAAAHNHGPKGCDHNHHNHHHNFMYNVNNGGLNGNLLLNGNNSSGGSNNGHSTPPSSPASSNNIILNESNNTTSVNNLTNGSVNNLTNVTKSPSKSKSRKISKFFSSRSKSPKTKGATSSSESGKSSVSSADSKSTSSSGSSAGMMKLPKSPAKHQSPSKNKGGCKNIMGNGTTTTDYQFTCDSNIPLFLPTPTGERKLCNNGPGEIKTNNKAKQK